MLTMYPPPKSFSSSLPCFKWSFTGLTENRSGQLTSKDSVAWSLSLCAQPQCIGKNQLKSSIRYAIKNQLKSSGRYAIKNQFKSSIRYAIKNQLKSSGRYAIKNQFKSSIRYAIKNQLKSSGRYDIGAQRQSQLFNSLAKQRAVLFRSGQLTGIVGHTNTCILPESLFTGFKMVSAFVQLSFYLKCFPR